MARHTLLLGLCLLLSPLLHAEQIHIPVGQQASSDLTLPQRGDSQRAVLETFGLADREHPPVGEPPISRWDYRTFSVYFEHDRVVNSVAHHQPHLANP
ncbi:phosphodiesterase [Stutzerimonas tarimensis]|uniref:Phosphodiesterase n=1 Tax=Stutzerimonas tarimensis TaxID=1507735 RepID=A0ABV7T034_9GAMM